MRGLALIALLLLAFGSTALPAASAQSAPVELVMFESESCPYCHRWNQEIGDVYAKTPEGRAAPLRRIDLHGEPPEDLRGVQRSVVYTPTFVLLVQGEEIGRIAGYPGENFFWPMLSNLLEKAHLKTN